MGRVGSCAVDIMAAEMGYRGTQNCKRNTKSVQWVTCQADDRWAPVLQVWRSYPNGVLAGSGYLTSFIIQVSVEAICHDASLVCLVSPVQSFANGYEQTMSSNIACNFLSG